MHQFLALIAFAVVEFNFLQTAVGIERTGGMEEQVVVADFEHATMRKQHFGVLAQFFTHPEAMVQFLHEQFLVGSKPAGVAWVDGGEMARSHRIVFAIKSADAFLVINGFEQTAVLHHPLGTALEYLSLGLELQHGDGFVHLGCEAHGLIVEGVALQQSGNELLAGVVAIGIHSKGGQWHEVDAIALLQCGEIGIAE